MFSLLYTVISQEFFHESAKNPIRVPPRLGHQRRLELLSVSTFLCRAVPQSSQACLDLPDMLFFQEKCFETCLVGKV